MTAQDSMHHETGQYCTSKWEWGCSPAQRDSRSNITSPDTRRVGDGAHGQAHARPPPVTVLANQGCTSALSTIKG